MFLLGTLGQRTYTNDNRYRLSFAETFKFNITIPDKILLFVNHFHMEQLDA